MIDYNNLITTLKNNYLIILIIIIILIIFFLSYYYYMRNTIKRVVVFDLDETIGCFQQLGIFCDAIEKLYKKKLTRKEFMHILDLYPEYFRPNIFNVMKFLKEKKIKGDLYKVCLYTNNQGPKEWARRICLYLDNKVNYKLFDNHIGAYIVDGIQVEPQRTTHDKTVADFLRTTKLGNKTQICFIDDLYHEKMDNDNVYYIHIEPYSVLLPINLLVNRFYNNNMGMSYDSFNNYIHKFMNRYNMSELEKDSKRNFNHNLNGKELMEHLELFLHPINKTTRRNKYETKNKTIKR